MAFFSQIGRRSGKPRLRRGKGGAIPLTALLIGMGLVLLGTLGITLGACEGTKPAPSVQNPFTPSAERAPQAQVKPPVSPPPRPPDPSDLRKRQFTDADFIPSEDNRDPFDYNLRIFVTNVVIPKHCIAQRLGLDELKLTGIIAGVTNPTALFTDPGGGAIRVRVNDLVGRQCARVKRIIHEILPPGPEDTKSHDVSRVVFEITEETGSAQPRLTEKIIWLNPQEAGR